MILTSGHVALGSDSATAAASKIDKAKLVQDIGGLMYSLQVLELGVILYGPHGFMDQAQGNKELAEDLYNLNRKCLASGGNQDIMSAFCSKWGIKELSARYRKADYK